MMQVNKSKATKKKKYLVLCLNSIGSHQVAKLQNMVENTRQRLNDLKHSQKTVDRSYNLLQVRRLKSIYISIYSVFRLNIIKHNMILMKHIHFIDN
jgi:hypothetical protein